MNTKFTHSGCNGWAIIDSDQVIGNTPKNYHVLEVKILPNMSGGISVYQNDAHETCCTNLTVKSHWQYISCFYAHQLSELRMKLAEMQNGIQETCGNCVKHFYADPDNP